MPRKLLATIVAATFITTGCTGPSEPTEADVQPPTTTEEAGPSVEEFASIIAEGRRDVDDWLETWHENYCRPMGVAYETDIIASELRQVRCSRIAENKF